LSDSIFKYIDNLIFRLFEYSDDLNIQIIQIFGLLKYYNIQIIIFCLLEHCRRNLYLWLENIIYFII